MKKGNLINIFFGIFAFVGIALLIGGILMIFFNQKFMNSAEKVNGVISVIETYRDSDDSIDHRVYVSYTYDGKRYDNVRLQYYSSDMYEGKDITLYFDPENPGYVTTKWSEMIAGLILTIIGVVFSIVGVVPISISVCKKLKRKKLLAVGRVLYATVEKIGYNTGYTVNGQNPYVIYCAYRDDYEDVIYRFKSGNLWTDPEPVITVGSTIKVYVKENNYKNYYVDAESMIQGKIMDYT